MDYGEVLGSAWRIVWKHKVLWIFGILAGCSRGGGGGGGGGGQGGGGGITPPSGSYTPFENSLLQFGNYIQTHPWVIALIVLVVLLIIVLALLLGTMGRIGLIRGALKADSGAERIGFAELWDESRPYFWRILLFSVIIFVLFLVVILVLAAIATGLAVVTLGIGLICLVPLFCLLVPAAWLLSIVIQQVESAIVIENLSISDGVRRGWDVFRRNLGPMLLMWLILLLIGLVVGIVLIIPIFITVVPLVVALVTPSQSGAFSASNALIALAAVCFCVYLPILIVLQGILTAYLQSAWTLTYLRLTRPKNQPLTESPVITAPNA